MVRFDVAELAPAIETDADVCIAHVREGWACLVIYLNAFVRAHSIQTC
jgi:hypothetical protein